MIFSSQQLRNEYEKFYEAMRRYLWSFEGLKALAYVEDDIYTSFVDFDKLQSHLSKLYTFIKDTCKDDEKLNKSYNALIDLIADGTKPDAQIYSVLNQVNEVNPENDKVLKTLNSQKDEEEDSI